MLSLSLSPLICLSPKQVVDTRGANFLEEEEEEKRICMAIINHKNKQQSAKLL